MYIHNLPPCLARLVVKTPLAKQKSSEALKRALGAGGTDSRERMRVRRGE